jgi:xanthine/uracil permease
VAVLAALLTAVFYSLPTLVLLGLATGLFGQLAKLSLDALIQRDVDDHVRARVFSWCETILQAFWVVGGAIGITLPLLPVLGFAIVTAVVVLACLVALRSRRVQ